jgi:hypothetical protein
MMDFLAGVAAWALMAGIVLWRMPFLAFPAVVSPWLRHKELQNQVGLLKIRIVAVERREQQQ